MQRFCQHLLQSDHWAAAPHGPILPPSDSKEHIKQRGQLGCEVEVWQVTEHVAVPGACVQHPGSLACQAVRELMRSRIGCSAGQRAAQISFAAGTDALSGPPRPEKGQVSSIARKVVDNWYAAECPNPFMMLETIHHLGNEVFKAQGAHHLQLDLMVLRTTLCSTCKPKSHSNFWLPEDDAKQHQFCCASTVHMF